MKQDTFLLIFLSLMCCLNIVAQQKLSFSILEFEQDVHNTAGTSTEYGKKDGNGTWYAIIKVTSNNPDDDITSCQFNFGNMSSKVEKHDEVLWVYVQRNAKKVTISRPGYHTISQYDLQTTIEAGRVYKMVLTSDRVLQQVLYDVKMQVVKFQTTPAVQGAIISVTNEQTGQKESIGMTSSNGTVSKALNFGRYSYDVLSPDNLYYPSEGIITLNNSDEVLTENVKLRPHFAEVSLSVANNAEIYINNELKGKGKWYGKLSSGTYIVNCKKTNHHDCQQKLIVEEGKPLNIELTSPSPITGALVINTNPTDAKITIDGKYYGRSPQILKDIIIGEHEVLLSLVDYENENQQVSIVEGEVTNIDVQLHEETKTPTILVVPSDEWCIKNNFMDRIDSSGVTLNIPNYKKALETNLECNNFIGLTNKLLSERGFTIRDFYHTIAESDNKLLESIQDELYQERFVDILVRLDWNVITNDSKKIVQYSMDAIDPSTAKMIARCEGNTDAFHITMLPEALEKAILSNFDKFCANLQRHYDDMMNNGREVDLVVRVCSNSLGIDLSKEYDGDKLLDIIIDWVADNSINNSNFPSLVSESSLEFKRLRIPMYQEDGYPNDIATWARRLTNELVMKYQIPCRIRTRGLGRAFIFIGEE